MLDNARPIRHHETKQYLHPKISPPTSSQAGFVLPGPAHEEHHKPPRRTMPNPWQLTRERESRQFSSGRLACGVWGESDPGTTTSTGATPIWTRFRANTQDPPMSARIRFGGERGRPMAYAKIITQYPDESAVVVEVGHDDGCHPDLLDELVARCRDLWQQTVADAVETDE